MLARRHVRRLHRHRPDRGVLRRRRAPPSFPRRRPATELRPAHHGYYADRSRHTRPRVIAQRKRAAGKSHREALRCWKRRLSDVACRQLLRDSATELAADPGGHLGRLYRPARQADTPHTGPVTSLTHQIPPYNRSHRFGFDTESGTTSSGSRTASADPHALGPMSDQLPARCPERLGRCRSRAAPADDGVPRLGVAGLRRPGRRQLLAHQGGTATQTRGALGDGSRPGNLDRSCSFVVLILSSRAAGRSFSGDTDPASSDAGATHL